MCVAFITMADTNVVNIGIFGRAIGSRQDIQKAHAIFKSVTSGCAYLTENVD